MNKLDRRFLDASLVVESVLAEPPASPAAGVQYIVSATPTANKAFAGHANAIAKYDGTAWDFFAPQVGDVEVLNKTDNAFQKWDGTAWVSSVSLGGAGDDNEEVFIVNRVVNGFAIDMRSSTGESECIDDKTSKIYVYNGTTWDSGTSLTEGYYIAKDADGNPTLYNYDGTKLTEVEHFRHYDSSVEVSTKKLLFSIYNSMLYINNSGYIVSATPISVTETHTLSATDITNKYVSLGYTVNTADSVLLFVSGVLQPMSTYTVTNKKIDWTEKSLDGELKAGDIITVHYDAKISV